MRPLALAIAVLLVAGGCERSAWNASEWLNPSRFAEPDSDLARTFESGSLVLPDGRGGSFVSTIAELSPDRSPARALPAVLFLHGCTGLTDRRPLRRWAEAGFAVIAPNSFARRFRPLQCSPSTKTGGRNVFVYDFRLAEISYALHRMRAIPWIDARRLVLVGISEGAVAAALYRGAEFKARVILQWTCHGRPLVHGLSAPPDEPILAVVQAGDPWYDPAREPLQTGDCGVFLGARPQSRSIVLRDGNRHDVLAREDVAATIDGFLRETIDGPARARP